ncbi:hypothetical protein PaP4_037 [Pseudomonas phage PaP4]|uniref:Uncharacterized protein n=1 Tax=Pseudomonas phage PaP4 TaxID=1273709 RepID=L7TMA6_9CAUD|nr:tail length tape measure protein [Pseudomonas phage PaP4]AGC35268.1 hypothetical protein PaP4_037 [Pseudomonas phage PaP4]
MSDHVSYSKHVRGKYLCNMASALHKSMEIQRTNIRKFLSSPQITLREKRRVFLSLPAGFLGVSYFSGSHLNLSSYSPKRNSRVREKDLSLYDDFYIDRNTQLDPRDLLFTSQEEKKWEFQYLKEKRGDGFELSDEGLSDVKDIQRKIDLSWYLVDLACERGCSYFIFDW